MGKGLAQLLPRDLAVHLEAAIALAVACMKKKGEFRKSALNEAASVRRAWPVALTRHMPPFLGAIQNCTSLCADQYLKRKVAKEAAVCYPFGLSKALSVVGE